MLTVSTLRLILAAAIGKETGAFIDALQARLMLPDDGKASPMNRPFIAQRLASQLGTLTAVAGADAATENRPAKVAQVAQPVARRPIAPLPVPSYPGTLAPGGVLRRAVP